LSLSEGAGVQLDIGTVYELGEVNAEATECFILGWKGEVSIRDQRGKDLGGQEEKRRRSEK